jgi:sugar lactone lactonase YvrE
MAAARRQWDVVRRAREVGEHAMPLLMTRRDALGALAGLAMEWRAPEVSTLIGTGTPGYSDREINDPYGLAIGADAALYFCDLGNQRIRRLDLKTRRISTIAGNGRKGYDGDGGPATESSLNLPHEIQFDPAGNLYIAERDNHAIRKVDAKTGLISTLAGTGAPGFFGDGGPASQARLRQPHSIALDSTGGLLICDVGNHRVRRVDLATGRIETYGGTGERTPTPDGMPVGRAPLNGPRTMVFHEGDLYLALREGNAIYRIASTSATIHHVAGTGRQGHTGDGGPARSASFAGPKGLACGGGNLYIADTENHVIRCINLRSGIVTTVLGTGRRGDGPEPDPLGCALSRPHGVLVDGAGRLYVADSEAHRIRVVDFSA